MRVTREWKRGDKGGSMQKRMKGKKVKEKKKNKQMQMYVCRS